MSVLIFLAYISPEITTCVIDQCDDKLCIIETSQGFLEIEKQIDYKEGMIIPCLEIKNNK
jgi:hypothetical protein